VGTAAVGGLNIRHDFKQTLIAPLAPHNDGTKQGGRCNHTPPGPLMGCFPVGVASMNRLANLSWGMLDTSRINVAVGIIRFGEVVRH